MFVMAAGAGDDFAARQRRIVVEAGEADVCCGSAGDCCSNR